jgi:flagellar biosynthesis GTPase FlhF
VVETPDPLPVVVEPSVAPVAPPAAAAAIEKRLVDGGLTAGLAADLVGEAVTHGLPFAGPRNVKKLVRSALTRRLPVMADLGPDDRVLAFVGTGGSGKSNAIVHLATAYANAGASVAVVALRSPDGGRALASKLEPIGVSVLISGENVTAAKKRLDSSLPLLTLIDTPAASPADTGGVAALAAQLKALGANEVHLALPATLSAQAAEELAAAMRPLGLTHLALTRADETTRPGAVVELAIALRRPLSYRCAYDGVSPLDPGSLAQTLLP